MASITFFYTILFISKNVKIKEEKFFIQATFYNQKNQLTT